MYWHTVVVFDFHQHCVDHLVLTQVRYIMETAGSGYVSTFRCPLSLRDTKITVLFYFTCHMVVVCFTTLDG